MTAGGYRRKKKENYLENSDTSQIGRLAEDGLSKQSIWIED